MKKQDQFIKEIQDNRGLIFKIASLYTDRREDREDLIQEIIYQMWKSFDSFERQSSRSTWMYRVAMNVAIQYFKKSKRRIPTSPIDLQSLNIRSTAPAGTDELWDMLQGHIQNLNLLERGILMLHLEEKSYLEIANIIGISESNVGTKLNRIKAKLKKQINS